MKDKSLPTHLELRQLESTLFYQLGVEINLQSHAHSITVIRSRKTGRVKQVYIGDNLFASIRANDGFIIPSRWGWGFLATNSDLHSLPYVEVPEDITSFIAEGKTLFSKHVKEANNDILPGDEVCIINDRGEIVASGKAVLPGWEMGRIKKGKAVKTR